MGVHRAPEELKEKIFRGTLKLVKDGGMANFSFPKLSAETGISAPTVYEYYENKTALLESCFLTVDSEVATLVEKILKSIPANVSSPQRANELCWLLWIVYWRYLISDADRTIFYWSFYNSQYYTEKVYKQRVVFYKEFLSFVGSMDNRFSISETHNVDMLVANLLDSTVASAVKVLKGEYENNEITVNTVYKMAFQPVFSALGINKDEKDIGGTAYDRKGTA